MLCNDVERRTAQNGSTLPSDLTNNPIPNPATVEASLNLRLVDASTGPEIYPNKTSVHIQLFAPSASLLPASLSRGEPVLLRRVKAKLSTDKRTQCIGFDTDLWTGFALKMVHRPGQAAEVVNFKSAYVPCEEEKAFCAMLYKWNRADEDVDSPAPNVKREVCLREIEEHLNWDAVVEVSA